MRVAFVVGKFPALSETFVLDQVTGLIDRGIEVDLYASRRMSANRTHSVVLEYDLMNRAIYSTSQDGFAGRRTRLAMLLRAARQVRSASELLRLVRHGRVDAWLAGGFYSAVERAPREYDVIHCHFGPSGKSGAAMRNMGVISGALVTTFHGYDMTRYVQHAGPGVYSRLFAEGDLFLPISEYWRKRLVELGCDPDRTRVHHMGVDCESFAFRARDLPQEGPIRLLSVCRLVEKKGVEFALRAVAHLKDRWPRLTYDVIGEGPERDRLAGLISELGIGRQVRLVGSAPREEVLAAMQEAHVLLGPSVTAATGDKEGIPVVLMEAMASGLPVLSTRHSGIPELVADGETGRLVEERDAEALANALEDMLTDPSAYRGYQQAARDRVEQDFNIDRLNDQLLHLFRDVAPRRSSVARSTSPLAVARHSSSAWRARATGK